MSITIKLYACVCLVYSVTEKSSFQDIEFWFKQFKYKGSEATLFVLIGNKIDLADKREVSFEEGEALAKKYGMLFFETSAKNGDNIKNVYEQSCQEIAKRIDNGYYNLNSKIFGITISEKKKK